MISNYTIFAKNLRFGRMALDKTKQEMAKILSTDLRRYEHYEDEEWLSTFGIPPENVLEACKFLGISVYDIMNTFMYNEAKCKEAEIPTDVNGLTEDEVTILRIYNDCSAKDKKLILELVKKFQK